MMNEVPSKRQIFMARMVLILVAILLVSGLIEYSNSPLERQSMLQDILARPGGPMTFRFILQPVMAAVAAFRDARKDAKAGRSPYLWTIAFHHGKRTGRLYEGILSTSQIILLGLVMDAIYQFIVLKSFYPGQAVIIALLLAFVPYLLLRGPIARILRLRQGNAATPVDPPEKTEP